VAESGALVEVVEGEVAVEAASEEEAVQPGRQLAFTAQGLGTDSARQEGRQLPHWVREAVNQNGSAWAEGVLPSLAGEKHADINR
ncbi:hypothetical protein HYR69_08675, partial [Candidatus Sumerlaeota bacterium]|nr:hypothetical protein [Candidatus Sumerlaeota bacterium]